MPWPPQPRPTAGGGSTEAGGAAEEDGAGDDAPEEPVTRVVVMDLASRRVLTELEPTTDRYVHIARWAPNGTLVLYDASGFDVSGFESYDIASRTRRELEYHAGARLASGSDESRDGLVRVFVDDDSRLHVLDLRTGKGRALAVPRGALVPVLAPDARRVALVEVEWNTPEKRDRLWVVDLSDGSMREVASQPVRAKTASAEGVAWSPDGRYVGMLYAPEAVVADTRDPGVVQKVAGGTFTWLDATTLLVQRGADVVAYRTNTRATTPFLTNARRVRVVR